MLKRGGIRKAIGGDQNLMQSSFVKPQRELFPSASLTDKDPAGERIWKLVGKNCCGAA